LSTKLFNFSSQVSVFVPRILKYRHGNTSLYSNTCSRFFSVIYDFDLTDAFFTTVTGLLKHNPPKQLYIGLEKRQVLAVTHFKIAIVNAWFELGGLSIVSTVTSRPSPVEIVFYWKMCFKFHLQQKVESVFFYTYNITITPLKAHFKYK